MVAPTTALRKLLHFRGKNFFNMCCALMSHTRVRTYGVVVMLYGMKKNTAFASGAFIIKTIFLHVGIVGHFTFEFEITYLPGVK